MHNRPTPTDNMAAQVITHQRNFNTDFKPLHSSPRPGKMKSKFLLSSSKMLVMLSLVQEQLDIRNVTAVCLIVTSDTSLLVKLFPIIAPTFHERIHRSVVIPTACSHFPATLFPCSQLSIIMVQYSTLEKASLSSNDLLWLNLLVEGLNDSCQVSGLPHFCGC